MGRIAVFVCSLIFLSAVAEAAPQVTMYGASWCGPCRQVRAFLQQAGVRFQYYDIDQDRARAAYLKVRGSTRGIPLTVIGTTKIVGSDLKRIVSTLQRAGSLKGYRPKVDQGGYGGFSAEWWQQQFRDLRDRISKSEARIKQLERVAADHVEKAMLQKMKEDLEIQRASLSQLNNDASKVSLPRNYRR